MTAEFIAQNPITIRSHHTNPTQLDWKFILLFLKLPELNCDTGITVSTLPLFSFSSQNKKWKMRYEQLFSIFHRKWRKLKKWAGWTTPWSSLPIGLYTRSGRWAKSCQYSREFNDAADGAAACSCSRGKNSSSVGSQFRTTQLVRHCRHRRATADLVGRCRMTLLAGLAQTAPPSPAENNI